MFSPVLPQAGQLMGAARCKGQGGWPWLQEVPGPCTCLAAVVMCSRQQSLWFLLDQSERVAQGHPSWVPTER